jgi:hypothetical protein
MCIPLNQYKKQNKILSYSAIYLFIVFKYYLNVGYVVPLAYHTFVKSNPTYVDC